MRILRLTFEEIDTEDKYNPDKNKKISYQQAVGEADIFILGNKALDYVKQQLLMLITKQILPTNNNDL